VGKERMIWKNGKNLLFANSLPRLSSGEIASIELRPSNARREAFLILYQKWDFSQEYDWQHINKYEQ
jgi:hypothetical protein